MLAQEVTVIRDYGGKRMVSDPSKYTLTGSTEHTVLVQHYELISPSDRAELVDFIINNIDFYLDRVMEISDGKMTVRKTNREIIRDLNEIVENNIRLYEYQVDSRFKGFSNEFTERIERIELLSWDSQMASDGNSTFNTQEMAYNYVVSQITALKDVSTRDLVTYAEEHIHEHTSDEYPYDITALPSDLDTAEWTVNSPLEPYDFLLATMDVQDITLYIEPDITPDEIPRGTDDRIVALLESNNKLIEQFGQQMIAMQEQMVEMRKEGRAFQLSYSEMSRDIRDLQGAIQEIRSSNDNATSNSGLRPLLGEETYVIQFEKNSDAIAINYRMELNEVYHLMMLDNTRKVMLTGYADISGNTQLNATISRKRALAVKSYLSKKGIDNDRMLVNYMGDAASSSENAADRKVEITWLGE